MAAHGADRRLYKLASKLVAGGAGLFHWNLDWIELTARAATVESTFEPPGEALELSFKRPETGSSLADLPLDGLHPRVRVFLPGETDPAMDIEEPTEAGSYLLAWQRSLPNKHLVKDLNTDAMVGADVREVIAALAENRLHWWPSPARANRRSARAGNAEVHVALDVRNHKRHGEIASVRVRNRQGGVLYGVGPTAKHPLLAELVQTVPGMDSPILSALFEGPVAGRGDLGAG